MSKETLSAVAARVAERLRNPDRLSPLERKAMADELDAALKDDVCDTDEDRLDWLECDLCGQPAAKPYDVGDGCICGGKFKVKEAATKDDVCVWTPCTSANCDGDSYWSAFKCPAVPHVEYTLTPFCPQCGRKVEARP